MLEFSIAVQFVRNLVCPEGYDGSVVWHSHNKNET